MTGTTVGFIGGGRVARIFLEGWERSGTLPLGMVVSDPDHETLKELRIGFPGLETTPDNGAAASQVAEMYRARLSALYPRIKP